LFGVPSAASPGTFVDYTRAHIHHVYLWTRIRVSGVERAKKWASSG